MWSCRPLLGLRDQSQNKNQMTELSGSINWRVYCSACGSLSTSGRLFFSTIWKIFNSSQIIISQDAIPSKHHADFMLRANLPDATIRYAEFFGYLLN